MENDCNYESNFEDEKRKKYVKERSLKPINQNSEANNAAIDQKFAELIEKEDGGFFKCTVCEKKIQYKRDMKRHLETHLSGLSYNCSLCSISFRTSKALEVHTSKKH